MSAATPSPVSSARQPPEGRWLDLSASQRRALPVMLAYSIAFLGFTLTALLGIILWGPSVIGGGFDDLVGAVALAGIFTMAAFILVVMAVVMAPRFLTHQGIAVDGAGITLVQDAKWWYSGRLLHIPWSDVRSIGQPAVARQGRRMRGLVLSLRDVPPQAKVPHWAVLTLAGAEPPRKESKSSLPRVFLYLLDADHDRLLRLVDTARADAASGGSSAPRGDQQPACTGGRRSQSEGSDHTAAGSGARTVPASTDGWLSLRRAGVLQWMVYCLVAVGLAVFPAYGLISGVTAGDGAGSGFWDNPVFLTLGALTLGGVAIVTVLAPRFWTRQGVGLTERGLSFTQRPMWWYRGRNVHIPWQDVHHITTSEHPVHEGPVLEIFLHRAERGQRLPRWAPLVPAGEARWNRAVSLPRVVIGLTDPDAQRRLELMLRRARPDLFDHQTANPDSSGARAQIAPTHYVNMRRRVYGWSLVMVVLLGCDVGAGFWVAGEIMSSAWEGPGLWQSTGYVALCVGLTTLLVSVAPLVLTRQGIAVDTGGVTLLQEPLLWFPGRTAHLPWSKIRTVRSSKRMTVASFLKKRGTEEPVVDLFPHALDSVARAPTWARIRPRKAAPASGAGDTPSPRVRLRPGDSGHTQLVAALRAFRPDLLQT